MCPPSYRRPRVMTQCNFSRWREKTVRRAGGEADEGRVTGSRFSPCFPAVFPGLGPQLARFPRRLLPPAGADESGSSAMPETRVRIYSRWYHLFLAYGEAVVNLNSLSGFISRAS